MIELLLFDVGGVLSSNLIAPRLARLAARHGLDAGALAQVAAPLRRQADLGTLSDRAFWEHSLAAFGVAAAAADWDCEPDFAEVPGTLELVRQLHGRLRLAILSNDSREMARARRRVHGFDALFAPILISSELGLIKPDPAIFRLAAARVGLAPQRCLFIDDLTDNTAAAAELGFATVTFTGAADLEAELCRRGVLAGDHCSQR